MHTSMVRPPPLACCAVHHDLMLRERQETMLAFGDWWLKGVERSARLSHRGAFYATSAGVLIVDAQLPPNQRTCRTVQELRERWQHVGRGKIPHDAAYYRHVSKFNQERADTNEMAKKQRGISSHGAGAMRFKTIAAAPKPASMATSTRGEYAGKKTGYGIGSVAYQNSVNAPKAALVNQQVRFGSKTHVAGADASAFNKVNEWQPASHMIITATTDDIGSPAKEPERAASPSPATEEVASRGTANFFGLKKSTRRGNAEKKKWEPNHNSFTNVMKSLR